MLRTSSAPCRTAAAPQERPRAARRSLPLCPAAASEAAQSSGVSVAVKEDAWLHSMLTSCAPAPSAAPLLSAHRAAALQALQGARLPSNRDEAFRVTDLAPLTQAPTFASSAPASEATRAAAAAWATANHPFSAHGSASSAVPLSVVFVDGLPRLPPSPTLPAGARLCLLSELSSAEASAFGLQASVLPPASLPYPGQGAPHLHGGSLVAQLNAALSPDALVLLLSPGVRLEQPLHLLHVATSAAPSFPRTLLCLGEGAHADVVEEFCDVAPSATATSLPSHSLCGFDAQLGPRAQLRHTRLTLSAHSGGLWLSRLAVAQAEGSGYTLAEAHCARGLSRGDVQISQTGKGTSTRVSSLVLAGGGESGFGQAQGEVVSCVALDHPDSSVSQLHKAVVASPVGRSVFDGGVRVGRAAQRTDAQQLSRSLLLCKGGRTHAKPSLQIVADDVRCTHGCTVSELSGEELFYFAARGVDAESAREHLVYSFASEVVQALPHPHLASRARTAVRSALQLAQKEERRRAAEWAAEAAAEAAA